MVLECDKPSVTMCSETKTGRSYRTLSVRDIQAVFSTGNSLFWNLNYRVSTKCNYNQEELKQINQNEVTQSLSLSQVLSNPVSKTPKLPSPQNLFYNGLGL